MHKTDQRGRLTRKSRLNFTMNRPTNNLLLQDHNKLQQVPENPYNNNLHQERDSPDVFIDKKYQQRYPKNYLPASKQLENKK